MRRRFRGQIGKRFNGQAAIGIAEFGAREFYRKRPDRSNARSRIPVRQIISRLPLQIDEIGEGEIVFVRKRIRRVDENARHEPH